MTKVVEDPYALAAKGKLKLKCDQSIKKKKRKGNKDTTHIVQTMEKIQENKQESQHLETTKTKAELAFLKQREKIQNQRIVEKASITHSQRVKKFNHYLDQLSEHFEMAKVSWTK